MAQNESGQSPSFIQGGDLSFDYQPLQFKLGFNWGWCFPYSAGIEFGLLLNELKDENAGVGLGISGATNTGVHEFRSSKYDGLIGN